MKQIKAAEKTWNWIKASELKPDSSRYVLGWVVDDKLKGGYLMMWCHEGRWYQEGADHVETDGYTVTHWVDFEEPCLT
jgi:hypothetical protein